MQFEAAQRGKIRVNIPPVYCIGCEACRQRCKHGSITMSPNTKGFLYPIHNPEACLACHACENVCPMQEKRLRERDYSMREGVEVECYVVSIKDSAEIARSTSCGVSYLLSKATINEGGVVFGAAFGRDWLPHHTSASTLEELETFRGSKYIASELGDSFERVKGFLRAGQRVLFSGTPCQISALKSYLKIDYGNLLTVSIVCHGVGSPIAWYRYLDEQLLSLGITRSDISRIEFRDLCPSGRICLSIYTVDTEVPFWSEEHQVNDYMRAYGRDYILRDECYSCNFKLHASSADVIIGDYWGGAAHIDKLEGRKSTIILLSEKGRRIFDSLKLDARRVDLPSLIAGNYPLLYSAPKTSRVDYFFKNLGKMPFSLLVNKTDRFDFLRYCRDRIRHNRRVGGRGAYCRTILHSLYLFLPVRYRISLRSFVKKILFR